MATEATEDDFLARLARVEGLLERLERQGDPALRDATRELVGTVLELHARGLKHLLELAPGQAVGAAAASDPALSGLLVLHGLHPVPLAERAQAALAELEPRLGPAGARCEGLSIDGANVRVRLHGQAAFESTVREALAAAAPDAAEIVVEVATALVPLRLGRAAQPLLGGKP